jgi:hypothetical protein
VLQRIGMAQEMAQDLGRDVRKPGPG